MTWLLFLVLLLLVGIGVIVHNKGYKYEGSGLLIAFFPGLFLVIALILLPIERMNNYADIASHESLRETVEYARVEDMSEYERVTILSNIADSNQRIARMQYLNTTIWNWYYPSEIIDVEPIR